MREYHQQSFGHKEREAFSAVNREASLDPIAPSEPISEPYGSLRPEGLAQVAAPSGSPLRRP
jgi:hypothetical protein